MIDELPLELADRYGVSDHYTAAQAQKAAESLGLRRGQMPFVLAAMCEPQEFLRGMPDEAAADYTSLRQKLIALFHIDKADFTCRDLTFSPLNPVRGGSSSMADAGGGGA